MNQLQDNGWYEIDFNIKCPVTYCPYFNQNTILVLALDNNHSISCMVHPGKIEHKIDHWYCGIIKGSNWIHLSFLDNKLEHVYNAMRKSDSIWVGFLISNLHFVHLSQYWKLYDKHKILKVKERNDIPKPVWIDLLISWVQFTRPDTDIAKTIWQIIQKESYSYNTIFHSYMKTVAKCFRDHGYRFKKTIGPQCENSFNKVVWVKVSKNKLNKLFHTGQVHCQSTIKGNFRVPFKQPPGKKYQKHELEIVINVTDSVPALQTKCYLKQADECRQVEARHIFGLTKKCLIAKYQSFYTNNKAQLIHSIYQSKTFRLGLIYENL